MIISKDFIWPPTAESIQFSESSLAIFEDYGRYIYENPTIHQEKVEEIGSAVGKLMAANCDSKTVDEIKDSLSAQISKSTARNDFVRSYSRGVSIEHSSQGVKV